MIEFSPRQKKTIASGLTLLSLAIVFAFVSFLTWCLFKALAFASSAIVPLILGFFLSLFFKPYFSWWCSLLKNKALSLVVMLLTIFVPLSFLIWFAGALVVDQVTNLISQGPELFNSVTLWFKATFPKLDNLMIRLGLDSGSIPALYEKYGVSALEAGSGVLKILFNVLSILVSLIFFVFFLMTKERKGSDITSQMPFLKENTRAFLAEQIDAFTDILVSFFQRQMIICLIEGVMYGTGFWLVGLPYGFLIGFCLGVMNLIPFFGSLVCLPVALPIAYFVNDGSIVRVILVLIVWAMGQFLDGYFITPKIQGDKTGLGYAGVIFSFFFWATVLGPVLGMLLAIPLSAFCVVLWRAVKSSYIKPLV
ncbi:MAG: AI-2E family transporter [Kiritimatiellae bacterium]|nr:AI-2E family transporter [Kiritimatiellia bacterium]